MLPLLRDDLDTVAELDEAAAAALVRRAADVADGPVLSTIDLFDGAFSLVTSIDDDAWQQAAATLPTALRPRLVRVGLRHDLRPVDVDFAELYGLAPALCWYARMATWLTAPRRSRATPRRHYWMLCILPMAPPGLRAVLARRAALLHEQTTHDCRVRRATASRCIGAAQRRPTGTHGRVLEVPLPGGMGRAMRDGALLARPGAQLGEQTFDQWLGTL